jgi:hypothetical protein
MHFHIRLRAATLNNNALSKPLNKVVKECNVFCRYVTTTLNMKYVENLTMTEWKSCNLRHSRVQCTQVPTWSYVASMTFHFNKDKTAPLNGFLMTVCVFVYSVCLFKAILLNYISSETSVLFYLMTKCFVILSWLYL